MMPRGEIIETIIAKSNINYISLNIKQKIFYTVKYKTNGKYYKLKCQLYSVYFSSVSWIIYL